MPSPQFDNSYARMSPVFFSRLAPTPVSEPSLIRLNRPLAQALGMDAEWLASPAGISMLAGNSLPDSADPIATVYAGHQFGSYNPQLGDGRALLLGELVSPTGQRYDLQLKGSGPTPYSRGGDGRSPLGPVIREYIVSEAMAALGVPTTRALAAISTPDSVVRESLLPGAVFTRVASSHLRIGTVQFFAAQGNKEALEALVAYTLQRHYPEQSEAAVPALALLEQVIDRQAALVARWQQLGFIHGVMNTDNMLLCGETVDYGPCAFMDGYHPETVFSSIDHGGRYAYGNQPGIAHWNLAALAQALLPLIDPEPEQAAKLAQAAVDRFPVRFLAAHRDGLRQKLGLREWHEDDENLAADLLALLAQERSDFTLFFRRLAELAGPAPEGVADIFAMPDHLQDWLERWRTRLASDGGDEVERQQAMYRVNPAFIPRNHQVQRAIAAASDDSNFAPFHALVERLAEPWRFDPDDSDYALPPQPEEVVHRTFCGT